MKMNFKKKTISLLVFTMILSLLCTSFQSMNVYAEGSMNEKDLQAEKQIVKNGEERSFEEGAVKISKTIAPTGEENLFDITLKVTTTEQIKENVVSPNAAVVLVMDTSRSMAEDLGNGTSKINAAKKAAMSFIENFADSSADVEANRQIGIVEFNKEGNVKHGLIDVKNGTQSLYDSIDSLGANEGTNIEDGLLKAREMLDGLDESEVSKTSRYILLLSDGKPTYHNTYRNGKVTGVGGSGKITSHLDHNQVYNRTDGIADKIRGDGTQIYSVYLGGETDKIQCEGTNKCSLNKYIVEWLGDFSTKVYDTTNADDLANIFEKISQIITVYANAWIVTDPMGEYIDFVKFNENEQEKSAKYADNTLKWDLKTDETAKKVNDVTTYTLSYQVRLDNVSDGFVNGKEYATNKKTTLEYYMSEDKDVSDPPTTKKVKFDVPIVKGYLGSFEFTKKGSDTKEGLAGAKFRLTGDKAVQKLGFKAKEVTSDANGKVIFNNIPSGYSYTLTEAKAPDGYVTDETTTKNVEVKYGVVTVNNESGTFDWFNTPSTTQLTIKKEWEDDNNIEGFRPNSIDVDLYKKGEKVPYKTITLNATEKWEKTIEGLPEYDKGTKIEWVVVERDVPNYTKKDPVKTENGFTIENVREPEMTTFSVEKQWEDNNNQDGERPENIQVQLLKNGVKYEKPITLDSSNKWQYTWKGLPKYANATKIIWTVKEVEVPEGYASTSTVTNNLATIINSYTTKTTSFLIKKLWNDDNNIEGFRPECIVVDLYKNEDVEPSSSVTLTANDKGEWETTVDNLPKYDNGEEIEWTIKERAVPHYTSEAPTKTKNEFTITNTHKVTNIVISGKKTWDDANNQDGIRPEYITVNLLANGKKNGEKKVSADDNWEWNFDNPNLVKYSDGEEIQYTITENKVDGYESVVNGYDITNSHKPETTSLNVLKVWNDSDDKDKIRPENVVVELYANDTATGKTVTLDEVNNWSSMFEDLDKYIDGKEVKYTVKEKAVEGYEAVYSDIKDGTISITNTHVPAEISPTPDVKPPVTPPKQDTNTTTKPTTGDSSNVMLWLSILVLSGVALVVTKKNKKMQ